MIYILYHDFTAGLRLSKDHRVAQVSMYGPFQSGELARIWASHELLMDAMHSWKVRDFDNPFGV